MAKIFDVNDWLKNHPNRNNFDLTHKVHGSYKFGVWYPFLCKPVVPTDSFKIDTAVSLRFMPMAFPTQSNMRAIFHYHYVRTKNIWKNFPNWLQGLEQHTPPYIDQPSSFYKDGSLADYLGVQTSYHVNESSDVLSSDSVLFRVNDVQFDFLGSSYDPEESYGQYYNVESVGNGIGFATSKSYSFLVGNDYPRFYSEYGFMYVFDLPYKTYKVNFKQNFSFDRINNSLSPHYVTCGFIDVKTNNVYGYESFEPHYNSQSGSFYLLDSFVEMVDSDRLWQLNKEGGVDIRAFMIIRCTSLVHPPVLSYSNLPQYTINAHSVSVSDLISSSPYYYSTYGQSSAKSVRVSALPFRAYESVMRCFYRNNQGVQPFLIGGQPVYNRWNTTLEDGADTTNYELFHRNWELDAYTSCLLSPQQDNSVYVGMTSVSALGNMRVSTPDGGEANIQLRDAGDNTIEYENLRSDNPEARRFALNVASLGFTIPQFREANALQRFLELNIRKGYRYVDFIEGHYGKSPKYSELDMPEFLGGFTQRISVNEISNTNGVDTDTLGAIAGQARAIGGSQHGVTHYFDDFGFIVGVMCLVPDVAYDCLLPKHFNVKDPLDMYFPEFNNVGMLPVTHEELAPVQTVLSGNDLTDVFGYQRPNHDLIWYPDTVHGRFRDATGIGNSIICRRFATMPELNNSFLEIDSGSTDTIFNYTLGTDDICLGEIVLKISAKRPIPRLVVPSING